ncbi:MAG TPA: ATP-binding protein [Fimbriimonadaceae bacterium]|nr:ATP-binding protein [Fimbriimonadaceae bacterium]
MADSEKSHADQAFVEPKTENERLKAQLQELEDSRVEWTRFFDLALDMLCISNADGYFKRLSPAFTTTLGWSLEELLTHPFMFFVHPDDAEATLREVERQVVAGELVLQFENRYRHKDGSWRILSWRSVPQPGGFMYATARDVTEMREAEARISSLNQGLIQRASELEEARHEAERANNAKSEFLSRMSHELRTPMNAVIGFAQLIEMESNDPNIRECVRSILRGGRHLLGLINEILDMARIEAGKLAISLEPVPLAEALREAIDLITPIAEGKGIVVDLDATPCEGLHVRADRQRLVQVMINLLSNAVKFNKRAGQVKMRCLERPRGLHRVEVKDTGTGIPRNAINQLFTPFERFGNYSAEGTGLGLALSRRLMELMEGELFLVETNSNGSTFGIELEATPAPGESSVAMLADSPATAAAKPLRIVYIEDNLPNLRLLERVFEYRGGIEMHSSPSAGDGIRLIREQMPDLVLLDLHLPDGHGYDVLTELRSDARTADIPVIVISADSTSRQVKRLLAAGAKSYLMKPLDLPTLLAEPDDIEPRHGAG